MYTTRSGRVVKQPVRYEPVEKVEDDYASDEYDSDTDGASSDDTGSDCSDQSSCIDPEEVDEHGNLRDLVDDSDEDDEEEA
jgi:hypothetical protein